MKILRVLLTPALVLAATVTSIAQGSAPAADTTDPYLWLEDRTGDSALEWVRARDTVTLRELCADSNFAVFQDVATELLEAKDRIPYVTLAGDYVYNFWQDAEHVRGIYRRTTLADYATPDPSWETVLDIDALNSAEGKSWVFHGANLLPPGNRRALVSLSDGGKDAATLREFDLVAKAFVNDGFSLPEAKSSVSWYDDSTVVVGTDFGTGSLTASGYPRIGKLWRRGTPLSAAVTLIDGDSSDVWAGGYVSIRPDGKVLTLSRGLTFWESQRWIAGDDGKHTEIPFPKDASMSGYFKGRVVAMLYSDWLGIPEGSIVALKLTDLDASDLASRVEVIYRPDDSTTVTRGGVAATRDYLLVSILRNVRGKVLVYSLVDSPAGGAWISRELTLPDFGSVDVVTADDYSNAFMLTFQDFLTPTKLFLYDGPDAAPREIRSLPAKFDASGMAISQGMATSADGTKIPYFLVARQDLELNGRSPTLLYGYGGFRSSETPFYSATIGKLWLSRGGVFVLANIRGGGEFGPRWHKAALLANRQRSYDDFIAVAEDLIARKITSPRHLGIQGGSNGGLLVGVAMTQRPDLFNAVVCQVPLLDMLRYTKLPPGASWIGEYGDPDTPDMRAYIATYSPYQNVKPGVKYPEVLFVTSTYDDRVHPGHARKMTAKLEALGNKVYYYEETEGGHAASADNKFRAKRYATEYTYLWKKLGE
jgi:prolyl oligopeptidase